MAHVPSLDRPALPAAIGQVLGLPPVATEVELASRIEAGLPADTVDALRARGFDVDDLYRLVLNRRTLARRKGARLAPDESDRVVRLARVYALARRAFPGAPDYALEWLREPKRALDGRAPLAVLATDAGARAVEDLLVQLEEGIYA
jgi:putative toxin-antitoxin system antitoxin component (TIGR02293 family)